MASSQSEQEGVEAMLGLGLVAGAGPADDPGEEEDDGPMIPGVMIKGNQEDIVRRARARAPGQRAYSAAATGYLTLAPTHARDKSWLAPGCTALVSAQPLPARRLAGDAKAEDVSIRQQPGLVDQEVRFAHPECA